MKRTGTLVLSEGVSNSTSFENLNLKSVSKRTFEYVGTETETDFRINLSLNFLNAHVIFPLSAVTPSGLPVLVKYMLVY